MASTPIKNVVLLNKKKYLLDDKKDFLAASYSVARKLKENHKFAFRVRQTTSGDQLDIGFNRDGNLDTSSLLAFCGNLNGAVVKLYDATGNENTLTNSTALAQPTIVSSGIITYDGVIPAMQFDGISDVLFVSTSSTIDITTDPLYLNAVINVSVAADGSGYIIMKNTNAITNRQYSLYYDDTNQNIHMYLENSGNEAISLTASITKGTRYIASSSWIDNVEKVYIDSMTGGVTDTYTGVLTSTSYLNVGARASLTSAHTIYFEGKISEINIMTKNDYRMTFEQNQKNYYNIA